MSAIRIPRQRMTCWELCKVIEREVKGLGTDDNTPVDEMAFPEQGILLSLLGHIEDAKGLLNRCMAEREKHDGQLLPEHEDGILSALTGVRL